MNTWTLMKKDELVKFLFHRNEKISHYIIRIGLDIALNSKNKVYR